MKALRIKHISILFFVLIAASCSKDDDESPKAAIDVTVADEIFKLTNEHRVSVGLTALVSNETANQLAVDHTNYMIIKGRISHDNFSHNSTILREKENAKNFAENVSGGYPDAKSTVNGWLTSSGHKANIEGNYSHTGIAAIKDANGKFYYTQIFYR